MATWRDFATICMNKTAGANAVPIAVGYQGDGKAYSVSDPEAFTGSRRMNHGSGATIGNPPPTKTWMGMRTYDLSDEAKKYPDEESDPYYHNILVGGANAAGKGFTALSALPFGVLAKGENKELFRNGEIEKIRSAIEMAQRDKKHVRVIGHSWGGADVARMAKDYPNVQFFSLDPVSWTGRVKSLPKNLTIVRPDGSRNGFDLPRGAQVFGGQWPKIQEGEGVTVTIPGDHVIGYGQWLTRMNRKVREDRLAQQKMQKLLNVLAARRKNGPQISDYFDIAIPLLPKR